MLDHTQTISHLSASDEQTANDVFERLIKSISTHYSGQVLSDKKSKADAHA